MKLVILGAAGGTGQQIVKQALDAGIEVTAFVRPTNLLNLKHPKLVVKSGDARDRDDLMGALSGSDAVISTIGSNSLGGNLITESTRALIEAMRAVGVNRVILMSTFLLSTNYKPGVAGKIAGGLMKATLKDKTSGEELLKASGLEWTIVYAAQLTNGPLTGHYRPLKPEETIGTANKISRADAAGFMLGALTDKSTFQKTITIK